MFSIPHVSLINPYIKRVSNIEAVNNKTNANSFGIESNTFATDTISFSGKKTSPENEVKSTIKAFRNRLVRWQYFNDATIDEISKHVTDKNKEFLKDILKLNNKKLSSENVITILDYINKDDTSVDEFRDKLSVYKNLKTILTGFAFKKTMLTDYLDDISAQGIVDILISDLLLREPKHNFNLFPEAYYNVVQVFEEQLKKAEDEHPGKKLDEYSKKFKAKEFMRENFASLLILNMIFDKSVSNEFIYNRGKYINSIYMPRIRMLNSDDLDFLRRVQAEAVTDKKNKGGEISVYEISLDDKIATLNHLYANREIINAGFEGIDFYDYVKPVNIHNKMGNFKIDFQRVKIDLMEKVLLRIGVDEKIVEKYMEKLNKAYEKEPDLRSYRDDFWDINYVHLINAPQGTLLKDIIVAATEGRFNEFMFKKGEVAEINKKNKKAFEEAGINYKNWLKPTIAPISKKFVNKKGKEELILTVKNWRRNPQESLFDGNYTTCCTGIDKDQGNSFPVFLTNTCTTTLEVRNQKDKVVAMSRILMAKVDGKLSLVVENIEVNNKIARHYLYNDETKCKLREMIFDYARSFAKNINKTSEEIPVYFSAKYYKVKDIQKGLKPGVRHEDVELIGEFPDKVYINAYGDRLDITKLKFADDGDEFVLHLSDITTKAKPLRDKTHDVESDSNYNYEDVEDYQA